MQTSWTSKIKERIGSAAGQASARKIAWGVLLSCALFVEPGRSLGQGAAPTLEWQRVDHAPIQPPGIEFVWNGDTPVTYDTLYNQPADTITAAESGTDWWNESINIYDSTETHIGYFVAGYSILVNWGDSNICGVSAAPSGTTNPFTKQRPERRLTQLRQCIARYDLNGNRLWFKFLNSGILHGLVQDREGNVIVTGEGGDRRPFAEISDPDIPMYLNPAPGQLYADTLCGMKWQATVTKLTLNGEVLWNNMYNIMDTLGTALVQRCIGKSIVETNTSGTEGYRIVGTYSPKINNVERGRPFVVDLDANGLIRWKHGYVTLTTLIDSSTATGGFSSIARVPFANGEKFAITGVRRYAGTNKNMAILVFMDDSVSTTEPMWFKDTYLNRADFPSDSMFYQNSYRLGIGVENDQPIILWPVMHDFKRRISTSSGIAGNTISDAGNHEATARLYKLDAGGNLLWPAPADFGQVRAFDLYFDAIQTADGNMAVSCTKWPAGYDMQHPWVWEDFTPGAQACLQDSITGLGYYYISTGGVVWDWSNPNIARTEQYGFNGTDSYVAKVSGADGSLLWEYQWDEGSGALAQTCFPENFRQRQCNFSITEATDGGLVVCGNTGHNFDDCYLAKLSPCDLRASYANLPLNGNNEYHITTSTTWATSMNVKGSIVVDPGVTLTVDNATIGFADSRQIGYTTNLKVMPNAVLNVQNNALLTSVSGCARSMWDGVKVLGAGTSVGAGRVHLSSGAKVSNAFIAVLASDGDPVHPHAEDGGSGGIIEIENSTFENNRTDVYRSAHLYPAGAEQNYLHSTFKTTAALNYTTVHPTAHVVLADASPTHVLGCAFENTSGLDSADVVKWGEGIVAFQTTLVVEPDSLTGDSCVFDRLLIGVHHLDLSPDKILKVDQAKFSCARNLFVMGTANARITRNMFSVPDVQVDALATYGTYLYGTSGFEFEENLFIGNGSAYPKVGSVFENTGPENNYFYNNRYNGFTGNGPLGYSAGTIIEGTNDGPDETGGLHIRCNDYSNTTQNDYDVAFTGDSVTVGHEQGSDANQTSPAGNTFAPLCGTNTEQHLYVELGAINQFDYYHHDPASTTQIVVPSCASAVVDQPNWYVPSTYTYLKPLVCPMELSSGVAPVEDDSTAAHAHTELNTLKDVYGDWADGGDGEGLSDFVRNMANSSYAVRNELMLVAPGVTESVWGEVFDRDPAMNYWHLAQALIANSPLQGEVVALVRNSRMDAYHKQLVLDAQNGTEVNMLSSMESEMAVVYGRMARAVHDRTAKALLTGNEVDLFDARKLHGDHPLATSTIDVYGLSLAMQDGTLARATVNSGLEDPLLVEYFTVQDLYFTLLENGQRASDLDANGVQILETIARTGTTGAGAARAWLALLGQQWNEELILPKPDRTFHAIEQPVTTATVPTIEAYPNPSNGPVYLVVELPAGVEEGLVRVMDPLGRMLLEKRFTGRMQVVEVDTRGVAIGLYTAGLYVDGIGAGTVKFEVVR